jgi:hypothetical protein
VSAKLIKRKAREANDSRFKEVPLVEKPLCFSTQELLNNISVSSISVSVSGKRRLTAKDCNNCRGKGARDWILLFVMLKPITVQIPPPPRARPTTCYCCVLFLWM